MHSLFPDFRLVVFLYNLYLVMPVILLRLANRLLLIGGFFLFFAGFVPVFHLIFVFHSHFPFRKLFNFPVETFVKRLIVVLRFLGNIIKFCLYSLLLLRFRSRVSLLILQRKLVVRLTRSLRSFLPLVNLSR